MPRNDPAHEYTDDRIDVIVERLRGMDRATRLLSETVNRTPTAIQLAVTQLRELSEAKFDQAGRISDEKFRSVQTQFSERDTRAKESSERDSQALAAALQAAKELVGAQADSSAEAALKAEASFTKQIDQIGTIIQTMEKALDARITELKERIDRGEGQNQGQSAQRTAMYALAGFILTVLLIVNFLAANGALGGR